MVEMRDGEAERRMAAEEHVEKLRAEIVQLEARLREERSRDAGMRAPVPRVERLTSDSLLAPLRSQHSTAVGGRASLGILPSTLGSGSSGMHVAAQLSDDDDELDIEVLEDTPASAPTPAPLSAAITAAPPDVPLAPEHVAPKPEQALAPSPVPQPAEADDAYYMQRGALIAHNRRTSSLYTIRPPTALCSHNPSHQRSFN
jgi:hypothetical protein